MAQGSNVCRHNLTEATREMVKRSTDDVKKVAAWPTETRTGVGSFDHVETIHTMLISSPVQPSRTAAQAKLSKDFTAALSSFQKVSRLSAEKQKVAVATQKRRVDDAIEQQEDGVGAT